MTHLRSENLAVVTRKTAEDHWVTNLDGTKSRAVSWCKCCRNYKPLSAFYLKSKRDRKNKNDVRSYCCICFDKQNREARERREEMVAQKNLGKFFGLLEIKDGLSFTAK